MFPEDVLLRFLRLNYLEKEKLDTSKQVTYCLWEPQYNQDGHEMSTSCGFGTDYDMDYVKRNHYTYCPFCGKVIKQKKL